MATDTSTIEHTPWWAWAAPLGASLLLTAKFTGLVPATAIAVLIPATLLLFGAVFAAVHHAEIVALRVGEPLGSIVLAVAVTVIEVALIVSMMLAAKGGGDALARDTVFAAVMLVLNGVVGLCLVFGGARHGEQSFREHGTSAALSVIGTLAVIALVLPNFTRAIPGPYYAPSQLVFVGFVSLCLYGVFLFVQTIRHREYFLAEADPDHAEVRPSGRATVISLSLLVVALAAVVLLAKTLSPSLENSVASAGLPPSFVGVVIAALVLLPEGLAAIRAARANRLQISLNLALGSALASIGLTIPAVAAVSLWLRQPLILGLGAEEMTLLVLTLFIGTVTLATGRTTILQGAVHLVILGVFLFLSAIP
ncbi:MAG: ionic transporter y4hA [Acetobacteraceae bacterium]|nr:ionic transporter y4hA [Acetobacteraceae bacterium]